MSLKQIKWKIRYYIQYFPFTINSFICACACWLAVKLLYSPVPKDETPSPFLPYILVMGKMAAFFIAVLVAFSVLSTFYCYIYYQYLRSTKNYKLNINFTNEVNNGKVSLFLNAYLEGVIRPLLGFVKGKLYYDDNVFTDQFSLLSNKRKPKSIWRAAISGKSLLNLPDIKEYELKGGFIYFQDMLHLVSLAVSQPITGHFYQPPIVITETKSDVQPKKTEQMDVRIEHLRSVEGEYFNYKDFEPGDDVRRIVWKVYARNRELVVRMPERFEPYASHLYFYASFNTFFNTQFIQGGFGKEMLNYYKNSVFTIYDTLSKKEWSLRYIPDQIFNIPDHLTDIEKSAKIISNSSWQQEDTVDNYFNPKHGSVLCISSFINPNDLVNVIDRCDATTMIYFVKLSNAFKHRVALNILKRIIFLPPQNRLARLKSKWVFLPIRFNILKREKALEEILKKSQVAWGVI